MMNGGISVKDIDPEITNNEYTLTLKVKVGSDLDNWLRGVFKKVCVYVNSEEDLIEIYNRAEAKGLPVIMIEDSGLTMFNGIKTNTCIAIGSADEQAIDEITGKLKLL